MKIYRSLDEAAKELPHPVLALGNFDGVHLGHRELFRQAERLASRLKAPWAVLTFDPHPAQFLASHLAPPLITTLDQRLELISQSGPQATLLMPFDVDLADLDSESFVRNVLVERLGAGGVVVGYDFTYGKGRAGTTKELSELGLRLGFSVAVVPPFCVDGLIISSTRARSFVLQGKMFAASLLLGRPFTISGRVVSGEGRGRTLGFPTANIDPEQTLIPALGVYAGWCSWDDQHAPASINIGQVPTFRTDGAVSMEVHILDIDQDLYGKRLSVEFIRRLRPERRFKDSKELMAQIANDIVLTREILLKL